MMPELGKYTAEVLASYAISVAILAGLVWISLRRSRRVQAALEEVEKRMKRNG